VLLGPEDLLHLRSAPVRWAVAASAAAEANGVDGEERGFGCVGSGGSFEFVMLTGAQRSKQDSGRFNGPIDSFDRPF
jgi:hypothetical protein